MKLNIGSGPNAVKGFTNIDFSPNVLLSRAPILKAMLKLLGLLNNTHMTKWDKEILYRDARKLRLPSGTVDYIYSSHFLEHVFYWEAQEILNECHRIMSDSGILRLALPDYKLLAEKFVTNSEKQPLSASWEFNRSLLSYPFEKSERISFFLNSRFGHVHKWHPTPAMLEEMLAKSGFRKVRSCVFQVGEFPNLHDIEHRDVETFYIEASK